MNIHSFGNKVFSHFYLVIILFMAAIICLRDKGKYSPVQPLSTSELSQRENGGTALRAEQVQLSEEILDSESFHLVEPDVINLEISGFHGQMVWFTGNTGISYSQLNQGNDPGIEVSDGKLISKPEYATAFMLKGRSTNGYKVTFTTK